jgi:hypothetical protein
MTHQHRPWGYSNSADGNSADGKLPDWDLHHPASTTHRRLDQATRESMRITESLARLSVGLEHASDLIKDLRQALR